MMKAVNCLYAYYAYYQLSRVDTLDHVCPAGRMIQAAENVEQG